MLKSVTSLKTSLIILLLHCAFVPSVFCEDLPAGQVVWWGQSIFPETSLSGFTNGVIESDNEILSNVVAIAAGLALKSDGTVFDWRRRLNGRDDAAASLSNVVSIAVEGSSCWAIKEDGTVAIWGNGQSEAKTITALSNITAIAWAGHESYLALKNDGTVFGFRFDDPRTGRAAPTEVAINPMTGRAFEYEFDPATGLPISRTVITNRAPVRLVTVGGQVLSNVVAMASGDSPLVLKSDGTVSRLVRREGVFSSSTSPYSYNSADPVTVDGEVLSNVTALASGGSGRMALKSDGTVVAWGNNNQGQAGVPAGLSNVVAISAVQVLNLSLALKRDGTVVAWGDNNFGETNVPVGLSNVAAIAAGGWFGTAITTGAIPASVYIRPHGRLEEMEREADLVFKGCVISTVPLTNAAFPEWGKAHATQLKVISVLKGAVRTNTISFQHNTHGPSAWSGGTPPPHYVLEPGQCYLIFAMATDEPAVFWQLTRMPRREDEGVTLAPDDRPLADLSIKEAHWVELNRLLTSSVPAKEMHAILKLNGMSERCGIEWGYSPDFPRASVLNALCQVITDTNDDVATEAISCFQVAGAIPTKVVWCDWWSVSLPRYPAPSNCIAQVRPYADALVQAASGARSTKARVAALAALFGTRFPGVSNSLARWLDDPSDDVRVEAVRLLRDFPSEFAEQALRARANDESANVRSVVADVIGEGKFVHVLPTLAKLFSDPVGRNPLIKPLTIENLKAGQRWSNIGDVHTSAGLALVKFDLDQVTDILKTNLNDAGFHINFVSKLAEKNPEPWLPELISILEARLKYVETIAVLPGGDARKYSDPYADIILIGTYGKCWEDIRQYLLKKSPEDLAGGGYDRYMDLLERMVWHALGCAGCSRDEPRNLYALYRIKRLEKRAAEVRRRFKDSSGWWFDDFDEHHQE